MRTKIAIVSLLMLCSISTIASASPYKFDLFFRRWGEFYFPWEDYKWWVAQGLAESNLNPMALSPAGAAGIMQIMPATATELGVKNRWNAEESIQSGIKYDSQIWKWWNRFCSGDKKKLTFSSYNAGMGNIKKAKDISGSCDWESIKLFLSNVTGHHSIETINYVKRIYKLMKGF